MTINSPIKPPTTEPLPQLSNITALDPVFTTNSFSHLPSDAFRRRPWVERAEALGTAENITSH